MHALSKVIANSNELESLSLEFFWCSDILDISAEIIVNSISKVSKLKELCLNFAG